MLKKRIVAFTARDGTTVTTPMLVGAPADYHALGLGDSDKDWTDVFRELSSSSNAEDFQKAMQRVQESYMLKYGFSMDALSGNSVPAGTPFTPTPDVDELYFLAETHDVPATPVIHESAQEAVQEPVPVSAPMVENNQTLISEIAEAPAAVSVADCIRTMCSRQNTTLTELAAKLDMPRRRLSYILSHGNPTKDEFCKIAEILGCECNVTFTMKGSGEVFKARLETKPQAVSGTGNISSKLRPGVNDLRTVVPELAKEWDYEKNTPWTPETIAAGSAKKVGWICSTCGHHWDATVNNRRHGTGCPVCRKRKSEEAKALKAKKTKSAPSASAPVKAEQKEVPSQAKPKASTPAKDVSPTSSPSSAATAKPASLLVGVNDLATTHPDLAKTWHPTKNGDVTPRDVTGASVQKAYWVCPDCGNEWIEYIHRRAKGNHRSGCPKCFEKARVTQAKETQEEKKEEKKTKGSGSQKKPDTAKNTTTAAPTVSDNKTSRFAAEDLRSLAIKKPQLAKEWHPTKNGNVTPSDVLVSWDDEAWWKCSECGHEWSARIDLRCKGGRCPACSERERKAAEEMSAKKKGGVKPTADAPFTAGDRVRHNTFGPGTLIKATTQANKDLLLEIQFDNESTSRHFILRGSFSKNIQRI